MRIQMSSGTLMETVLLMASILNFDYTYILIADPSIRLSLSLGLSGNDVRGSFPDDFVSRVSGELLGLSSH